MAGVLFNILIPTERHETHLTLDAICDCSSKNKHSFNTKRPTYSENGNGKSSEMLHQQVSMEKVSFKLSKVVYFSASIISRNQDRNIREENATTALGWHLLRRRQFYNNNS